MYMYKHTYRIPLLHCTLQNIFDIQLTVNGKRDFQKYISNRAGIINVDLCVRVCVMCVYVFAATN